MFGYTGKWIEVTTVSGHPVSLCHPAESGYWRLCQYKSQGRKTNIFAKTKGCAQMQVGLIPELQSNQQQEGLELKHQDFESSFQQGRVAVEGLSGYRSQNLGSPQATLSNTGTPW